MPIRVLIADDHIIVREGLATLLSEEPEFEIVGQAATGDQAIALSAQHQPDVVLMDVVMPGIDGIEATRQIRRATPGAHILILTSFANDSQVRGAIQAGATGYLMKDVLKAELLSAIRAAARGVPTLHPEAQRWLIQQALGGERTLHDTLTERERDVLVLLARGQSNKEIAATLHLTEGTVKGYVSAILAKLEVADRTQAALYAVKHGLAE
jgi:DNA-binding NarL/FixJ family response regulator